MTAVAKAKGNAMSAIDMSDLDVVDMEEGQGRHQTQARDATDVDNLRAQAEDVKLREKGVADVQKSVQQIHNMMKEIAVVVEDNNELINETEAHIEDTKQGVKGADGRLERALKYQKWYQRQRVRVIIGISLIIAIVVIILVVILGK